MTTWTNDELGKIGAAEELEVASLRGDGTLRKPVTAPIVGATKIAHLEEAVGALSVELTPEEVAYVEEPYVPHRIVGHQ